MNDGNVRYRYASGDDVARVDDVQQRFHKHRFSRFRELLGLDPRSIVVGENSSKKVIGYSAAVRTDLFLLDEPPAWNHDPNHIYRSRGDTSYLIDIVQHPSYATRLAWEGLLDHAIALAHHTDGITGLATTLSFNDRDFQEDAAWLERKGFEYMLELYDWKPSPGMIGRGGALYLLRTPLDLKKPS